MALGHLLPGRPSGLRRGLHHRVCVYSGQLPDPDLGTPARIYYKYEGGSPAGSHKPNTAVPQAYYNAQEGVTWISSYVSEDKTRTFCVYDAPSPEAIRKTALRNALPHHLERSRGSRSK